MKGQNVNKAMAIETIPQGAAGIRGTLSTEDLKGGI